MKYTIADAPKCEQNKTDCFANLNNQCRLLDDTHFNRECPFYKKKDKQGDLYE